MRSRYCAYVKGEIDYLTQTLVPEERPTFSPKAAKEWSESAEWLGLEIVKARGGVSDVKGEVEFIARFKQDGLEYEHHELSTFKKRQDRWLFADGKIMPKVPVGTVISRNAPCPCGSGKKYKRCCATSA